MLALQFGRLGYVVSRAPALTLFVVVAVALSLASGLFVKDGIVDGNLFDSLLLRPGTRVQRESDWVTKYEDDGYASGSEATNCRATRGGKNLLTRKNLLQNYRFWRDADVNNIRVEHRGEVYMSTNVLTYSGPAQPYRFTVLDCFQEGSYDYIGDVSSLSGSAALVVAVVNEIIAPFSTVAPTITPYTWCLYLRFGIIYAPSTAFDSHTFGRCRQFLQEDPGYDDLEAAYDFSRFQAYDWAKSNPSTYVPWGCKVELRDETACHPELSCCETAKTYSSCALCEGSGVCEGEFEWESDSGGNSTGGNATSSIVRDMLPSEVTQENCELLQELLGIDSWEINSQYDSEYASEQPSCSAFDFYPLSTLYASSIGVVGGGQVATSTNTSDCAGRKEMFMADSEEEQRSVVEFAVSEMYCKMFGGASTCPDSLEGDDYDWRLPVATEFELNQVAASGTCTLWDGGPEGTLRLFPYIPLQVIIGDLSREDDGTYVTKAVQTVQVSSGYKAIRDAFREEGADVSTKHAREGREEFLAKYTRTMHGRHDGGSLVFGTYNSGSGGGAQRSASQQLVPETYLVVLAYCLILVYTVTVVVASGEPSTLRRVILDAGLALSGVCLAFLGLVGGMGIAVYANLQFNPVSVQVLPFLVLGLGINDMYVFTHRHLELLHGVRVVPPGGGAALAARVAADAGASVCITTFANVCVFVVAALVIKMRMIAQFSLMAACSLAGTWFCIVFGFTAVLSIHANLVFKSLDKHEGEYIKKESSNIDGDATNKKDTDGNPVYERTTTASSVDLKSVIAELAEEEIEDEQISGRRHATARYAKALCGNRIVAMAVAFFVAAGLAVIAGVGIPQVELNYAVNYIFARRSSEDIFWRTKLKYLSANFFDIHTGQSDFARKHPLLASSNPEGGTSGRYSLMEQVMDSKRIIKNQESWYNVYIAWNFPCGAWSFESGSLLSDAEVVAKCQESEWYSPLQGAFNSRCSPDDALTDPAGACGPVVSENYLTSDQHVFADRKASLYENAENDLSSPLIPACTAWPVQYFMCDGAPCFGPDELTRRLYDQVMANETLVLGVHPDYFYECFDLMLRHDSAHELRSPSFNCYDPSKSNPSRKACVAVSPQNRSIYRGKDGEGDIEFTQSLVWASNLKTGENWLTMFRSLRKNLNDFVSSTKLDAYPHGTFWTFYYQFMFIEGVILEAFGFSALVVFCLTCVFFMLAQSNVSMVTRFLEAAWLAFLVIVGVAIQIIAFVGIMGLTDLWLNCFTLATVIVSFGIAIEGVAHTAFGYLDSRGKSTERAASALDRYLLPIVDGAFTTFLGFAPIAGSKYLYVVMYYFVIYAILVFVAFFIAVVLFPAMLAAFGRKSHKTIDDEEEEAEPIPDINDDDDKVETTPSGESKLEQDDAKKVDIQYNEDKHAYEAEVDL